MFGSKRASHLDRSVGDLLDKNGISYEQSVAGELPATLAVKP